MPPLRRGGQREKSGGRRALDEPSLVQEQDLVAEAARLPEVVRAHHDLRSGVTDRLDDPFHLGACSRVEARGGLVQEQHLRSQCPGAREREPLLLAAREHARGAVREMCEPDALERRACLRLAVGAGDSGEAERVLDVRDRRSPQHHRPLEHHRLPPPLARPLRHGPLDAPGRRRKQPVAEPHEHALPCPVRPEDDRARPGLEHERDTVDDRPLADDERHVVEPQRQDGCRRAHRFLTHSAAAQLP